MNPVTFIPVGPIEVRYNRTKKGLEIPLSSFWKDGPGSAYAPRHPRSPSPTPERALPGPVPGSRRAAGLGATPATPAEVALIVPMRDVRYVVLQPAETHLTRSFFR
jgi:hypothetical protein